jgi:hypothetical protein
MSKRFSLAEAESLIGSVEPLLRRAIQQKSLYAAAEREVQVFHQRIQAAGGMLVDREEALGARTRRDTAASELRETIESVQEFGCVVKDLDIGLLDFPTSFRGREVYLCWRLGEPEIAWWHGTDEGFAGRKPIDDDFRKHHRGDPAN